VLKDCTLLLDAVGNVLEMERKGPELLVRWRDIQFSPEIRHEVLSLHRLAEESERGDRFLLGRDSTYGLQMRPEVLVPIAPSW